MALVNKVHRKVVRRLPLPMALTSAPLVMGERTFITPKSGKEMCEITEPWMLELLTRILPAKPGLFLDAGVNLGQTLLAVKACDPARQYAGLEPNPQCVAYAESLIELNGLTGCQIVPAGLGEEDSLRRLQLYHGTSFDMSASIVENFRPGHGVSSVKIVPVFTFASIERALGLRALGVVKIDVEGCEGEVLSTMRAALERDNPWLLVEILPCYSEDSVERIGRQRAIETLLDAIGYVKFRISRGPNGKLKSLLPVASIGVHGNMDWCDYVLCPRADAAKLAQLVPMEDEGKRAKETERVS
jgi:FkbM family methyltransferase